jgi:hypothetical protein
MAGRQRASVGLLLLVAGVAFLVRVNQTYASSWLGDQLVPYDSDPYYQLRRIELFTHGDFPPGGRDRFAIAPDTFRCPWPVGLPVILGALAALAGAGSPSRAVIEQVAAWAIPAFGVFGALLMAGVFWQRDRRTALLAAFAFAVLPTSRMVGHFARIDHHVLEPSAALALFLLTPSASTLRIEPGRGGVLLAAIVGFVCALTVDLTYFALGALTALQLVLALMGRDRPSPSERARLLAVGAGVAVATIVEVLSAAPRVLSPEVRLALALAYASAGLLVGASPRVRRVALALLALATSVSALEGLRVLRLWSGTQDPITHTMTESMHIDWLALGGVQLAFHLVPVVAGVVALSLMPSTREPALCLYVVMLGLAMFVQLKYQSLFSIAEAAGWALLPAVLASLVPPGMRLLRAALVPATVLVLLTFSALLAPPNLPLAHVAIARDLARLAAEVPAIADPGWYESSARPRAVTLAHPVDGARFGYLARVAVSAIPFWSQPSSLRRYLTSMELLAEPWNAATDRRLRANQVRYVLAATPLPTLQLHEHLRLHDGSASWPRPAGPNCSSASKERSSRGAPGPVR